MDGHGRLVRVFGAYVLTVSVAIVAIGARPAWCVSPFSYKATLPDAEGMNRDISFKGQTDGKVLQGIVTVEGNPMEVTAVISQDGSIAGAVSLGGRPFGTFAGTAKADRDIEINYTVNGRSGTSVAPRVVASDLLRAISAAQATE